VGTLFRLPTVDENVTEVTLDDRGRFTLPKRLRERFGDRFHVVELHDGIKLVPVAEDPLSALREEFDDVDTSAAELRESGRKEALDEAGT
jgi:bifunctional DNA-binding transcriptional regulator/antitoxin component of YhaV-PrlF toxin-antitoxin module